MHILSFALFSTSIAAFRIATIFIARFFVAIFFIFVGHSNINSHNAALVLSSFTRRVSPQNHLVHDNAFLAIIYLRNGTAPSNWDQSCKNSSFHVLRQDTNEDYAISFTAAPVDDHGKLLNEGDAFDSPDMSIEHEGAPDLIDEIDEDPNIAENKGTTLKLMSQNVALKDVSRNASKCFKKLKKTLYWCSLRNKKNSINHGAFFLHELRSHVSNPIARVTSIKNETFASSEGIKETDFDKFVTGIRKEILDHEDHVRWEVVPRNSIVHAKVLKSASSFKRETNPHGVLDKHKARACHHDSILHRHVTSCFRSCLRMLESCVATSCRRTDG